MSRSSRILCALLLTCGGGTVRGGLPRPYGGEIRLQARPHPQVDPARADGFFQLLLVRQVHETLLRLSANGECQPSLLLRSPEVSADGRELTLELRPQLVDQRGFSLEAQDVVASWQRLLAVETESPHWWLLAPIEGALEYRRGAATGISGLEVEHRLKLKVRLRYPLASFWQVLGAPPTAPLSLAARSASAAAAVGSGPFIFRTSTNTYQLEAFRGHAAGRPFVDRLLLVNFPSASEAAMALGAGRLEVAFFPAGKSYPSGARPSTSPAVWPVYLLLNRPALASFPPGLDSAIDAVLDRRALASYAGGEGAAPMRELLGFSDAYEGESTGAGAAVRDYVEKLALATRGVAPLVTLLVRGGDPLERLTAERIQVDLLALGVVVSVVEADETGYRKRLQSGDYHLRLVRPYLPGNDESLFLLGVAAWLAGGEDERLQLVSEILTRLEKLPEPSCGETLMKEMARGLRHRLPAVPLFRHSVNLLLSPALQEFIWEGCGLPDLARCWLLPKEKGK